MKEAGEFLSSCVSQIRGQLVRMPGALSISQFVRRRCRALRPSIYWGLNFLTTFYEDWALICFLR